MKTTDIHLSGVRVLRITQHGEWLTLAVGHDGKDSFVADAMLRLPSKHVTALHEALARLLG